MNTIAHRLFRAGQILARILGSLALLALGLFCAFGFLASFEPGNGVQWRIGYGLLGCGCLAGATAGLLRPFLPRITALGIIMGSAGLFVLAVLLLWFHVILL
jgi:hypothetical protein